MSGGCLRDAESVVSWHDGPSVTMQIGHRVPMHVADPGAGTDPSHCVTVPQVTTITNVPPQNAQQENLANGILRFTIRGHNDRGRRKVQSRSMPTGHCVI